MMEIKAPGAIVYFSQTFKIKFQPNRETSIVNPLFARIFRAITRHNKKAQPKKAIPKITDTNKPADEHPRIDYCFHVQVWSPFNASKTLIAFSTEHSTANFTVFFP